MKALKISLIFTLLLNNVAVSQDAIYIYQKVGGILTIPMNNIDSIIFYDTTSIALDTSITNTSSTIIDADGNVYTSVIIGKQEWMAENLRTTKYTDGTAIPNVTDDNQWESLISGAWCYYENDNQYDTVYGKLYNWYSIETGILCPADWHIPTDAEWNVLTDYLTANGHGGSALKSISGWINDDGNAKGTDYYEWFGLPSGGRDSPGYFEPNGISGFWWTSSESATYTAWSRHLGSDFDYVNRINLNKKLGFSVRCMKD